MSIIDDLIINAKSAVNAVSKKAEKVIDVSKLKYAESGLQSEINKKLQALGKFVYDSYVSGEMDKEALTEKITELKELNENLESTKQLINAQKNKVTCKACGEVVSADLKFCGNCGAKLYSDTFESDDENADNNSQASRDAQKAVREAEADIASN